MNNVFEYYEYYTLKLKTLAPIFIGSGKSVGKKEFCYIPETNRIVFMDMKKIIDYIFENKPEYIKWFEKFMLDDASLEKDTMRKSGEFKGGLRVFLDAINMDEKTRKDCTIYEISNDGVFGESNTLCDIQCFMRGSDGRVYIPGSSLKGMIYTMLLQQLIRKNRNKLGNEKYSINKKKDIEDAEIRPKLTNTLSLKYKKGKPDENNAVNSIMRGIMISDSEPLSNECLTICKKLDMNKEGEINSLNVVRECIRPDTEISFKIKIDKRYFKPENISGSFEDIFRSMTEEFDSEYNEYYLSKFPKDMHYSELFNDNFVILGGGSGYFGKNIVYTHYGYNEALKIVSEYMQKTFRNNNPDDIGEHGISPHVLKLTEYNGKKYHLGVCSAKLTKESAVI